MNSETAYLREKDVSAYTGLTLAVLRKRRMLKMRPDYVKVGRCVLYPRQAPNEYLTSCAVETRAGGAA